MLHAMFHQSNCFVPFLKMMSLYFFLVDTEIDTDSVGVGVFCKIL